MRTDELRDVLRTHAEDVASPPASARLGQVRGRVAAVRRRRAAVAGGGGGADAFGPTGGAASVASAHELALLCAVFCFGAMMDPGLPAAPLNAEAQRYYQLCRAALSLEPIMDRPPGIATVQVLVLMGMYQVSTSPW